MKQTLLAFSLLGLVACTDNDRVSEDDDIEASASALSLSDGTDVCFRQIEERFGKDLKVVDIIAYFSPDKNVEEYVSVPAGQLTMCTVQFQDPSDPRKLLQSTLYPQTLEFSDPQRIEVNLMGADPVTYRLDDNVIALKEVDAAALSTVMEQQKAELEEVFSAFSWTQIRLSQQYSPDDPPTYTLYLNLTGRLASNDVLTYGSMVLETDGQTIVSNELVPQ